MDRSRLTRWAAPVAFLVAITIGALVVRAGFEYGRHHQAPPTTTTTSKKKKTPPHHRHQVQTYTVLSGDTLDSIATKTGTTVEKLKQLNPHVDPAALQVGEKIRVK